VVRRLRDIDRLFTVRCAVLLTLGLPLSLLGTVILAPIFWFAAGMLLHFWVSLWWYLAAVALITVPLLYRLEVHTGGNYLIDAASEAHIHPFAPTVLMPQPYSGLGAVGEVALNPRKTAGGLVEFFLLGPRLTLRAIRSLRQQHRLGPLDQVRAAGVLIELLQRDSGIDIARLVRRGETRADLVPLLARLGLLEIVGVDRGQTRVWLLDEARRRLARSSG
jgi:hypothetical protein